MRFAPVLQDVAARLTGRPATTLRDDPVAWAYALRDAVAVVEPDVIVSHLDPRLEHDALAPLVSGAGDPVDALLDAGPLGALAPAAAAIELVRTLAGSSALPVAATVTGPATLAAALAPGADDPEEVAELCGDALAGFAALLAEAGAAMIVVAEREGGPASAHGPLVRALALHGVEAVLWSPHEDAQDAGYPALARPWAGAGAAPPVAVVAPDPGRWPDPADVVDVELLLTGGPVPADADLDLVRARRRALTGVV